ncbi:uncharacterized protein KGF55_003950 [Candida pseudojiufengensis]|uniref:uncharacterized protein n=1 Tax=Candida pseudojiufengensis TaxID=497109 RepID=UPI0022241778|nr:uncharacterized protein KGF55_003950 [Candida pseudojiufengensis]KAI5961633.1 hypothetical protein KGF55_003950 [Candida pseudojiufengensis]
MDQDVEFKITDQNDIQVIISVIHQISWKSALPHLPTEISLSQTNFSNSSIHYFKSNVRIRRGIYFVKVKYNNQDKFEQFGVLFPLVGDQVGLFKVDQEINACENDDEMLNITNFGELSKITKKLELQPQNEVPEFQFSMKPPSKINKEEFQDPITFLKNRYYQSLYSLNEPLVYFPKTSIPRFKNLCKSKSQISEILSSIILNIDNFDSRYGPDVLINSNICEYEMNHRSNFMVKNGIRVTEEKIEGITTDQVQNYILDLKIREAQLQIILIFEFLLNFQIDEEEFLKVNSKRQESMMKKTQENQKPSLVRSKRKKTIRSLSPEVRLADPDFVTYSYLNKLIDRLNLWDVLTTKKDKDSKNILQHVLILYYHKNLPQLTKFVIDNMKGINMKLTTSKKKSKVDVPSKKIERPKLVKNDNSDLIKDISIASLKRSKSNLGQSKDLDKRQINLELKPIKKSSSTIEESSSLIFSKAKRNKTISATAGPSTTFTQSFSQIQATPAKQRIIDLNLETEIFTPQNNHVSKDTGFVKPKNKLMTAKLQQIAQCEESEFEINSSPQKAVPATPQHNRRNGPQVSPIVTATPQSKIIEATPRKRSIDETPNIPKSTPRTKPGDPIPLSNSPIYNPAYSQTLFNDNETNDYDYDSDEIFNPTNKSTYFKK